MPRHIGRVANRPHKQIMHIARAWGTSKGYGSGGGFAASALFPYASAPVIGMTDIIKIEAGFAHTAILDSQNRLFLAGENINGNQGQGRLVKPGFGDVEPVPRRVTGGIPVFNEEALWHIPRIPGARLVRPQGPLGPLLGTVTDFTVGSAHTFALRSDGTVLGWGGGNVIPCGFLGPFFSESWSQPDRTDPGFEGGYMLPIAVAPTWALVCYNSELIESFTKFGQPEAPVSDPKVNVGKTLLGEVSGTVKVKAQNVTTTYIKWTKSNGQKTNQFDGISIVSGSKRFTVVGVNAAEEMAAIKTDGSQVLNTPYVPANAIIRKPGGLAANEYEFEAERGAFVTLTGSSGASGASSPQIYESSIKSLPLSPDVVTMVASGAAGEPLIIQVEGLKPQTEQMIFVRQDANGGHAINIIDANGNPVVWGHDPQTGVAFPGGKPPINTRAAEVGPLTFNGDPVTEYARLGDASKWRYTINTGPEANTVIALYWDGTTLYGGIPRPIGDGTVTPPVRQVACDQRICIFLLEDGSLWISGEPKGGISDRAFAQPMTETRSFAGPDTAHGGQRPVGSPNVASISVAATSLAIMDNGQLVAFGWEEGVGSVGTLADGNPGKNGAIFGVTNPVRDNEGNILTNIVQVSASQEYAVAVDSSGRARTWGRNSQGELGLGHYNLVPKPTLVPAGGGPGELPSDDPVQMAIACSSGLNGGGTQEANGTAFHTRSGNLYTCGGNGWGPHSGGLLGNNVPSPGTFPSPMLAAGVPQPVTSVSGRGGTMMHATQHVNKMPKPLVETEPLPGGRVRVVWRLPGPLYEAKVGGEFTVAHHRVENRGRTVEEERLEKPNVSTSDKRVVSPNIPNKARADAPFLYVGKDGTTYTARLIDPDTGLEVPVGNPKGLLTYEYIVKVSELEPKDPIQATDRLEIFIAEDEKPLVLPTSALTIAPSPFTITGTTISGSPTLKVSTTVGLVLDQELKGDPLLGIPMGTTISEIGSGQVTMSQPAIKSELTARTVTVWGPFTKNGDGSYNIPVAIAAPEYEPFWIIYWRHVQQYLNASSEVKEEPMGGFKDAAGGPGNSHAEVPGGGPGTLNFTVKLFPAKTPKNSSDVEGNAITQIVGQSVAVEVEGGERGAFRTRTVLCTPGV